MDSHPLIGKILADDYKIESFLGKGGMGMVFVGQQLSLNRKIAVKLLPTLDLSFEEAYRFEAEIAAMATLCHSNIVTIHHRGKYGDPPTLFYVMEFLEGGSLKDYLREYGKLPISTSLRLVHQVAEGLAYAHEQGCIHRDIKPDNLLFNRNYRIMKIADFGIAKQISGPNITHAQNMVGTFLYAAPEQMHWFESDEESPLDARADQYSLGIVLYEMISGKVPYPARNIIEMMKSFTEPPTPLAVAIGHSVPQSVEWLINTMISKDREKRFANDDVLLEAISGVEMEQAASSTTRVFAIKTEEMLQIPPPQTKTAVAPTIAPKSERLVIQNLKTEECSPSEIMQAEKRKKTILIVFISVFIVSFLSFIFILIASNPKNATIQLDIEYEPIPPVGYPAPQIFVRNLQTNASLQLPNTLDPGKYQLAVILTGYVCETNGKDLSFSANKKPYILKLKLTAIPRKIEQQVLNLSNNQHVVPLTFIIDKEPVLANQALMPGEHHLFAQFQDYDDINTKIIIPPGNDNFCYSTVLRPLKHIHFSFQPYSYPGCGKLVLQIFIDNQELIPAHYESKAKDDWLYVRIQIPEESKMIVLYWGFYYEELPTNQVIVPLRHLSKIDGNKLVAYLEKNTLETSELYTLLWNEHMGLANLSPDNKQEVYRWLVKNTKSDDLRNIQTPLWLLRQLLNENEAEQRKQVLAYLDTIQILSLEERIALSKKLKDKLLEGSYRQYIGMLEEYDQSLWDYEKTCRSYVSECILSPSEKRTLQNLARKFKKEDIEKIHQKIEIYIKELKCKRTFQEMLED